MQSFILVILLVFTAHLFRKFCSFPANFPLTFPHIILQLACKIFLFYAVFLDLSFGDVSVFYLFGRERERAGGLVNFTLYRANFHITSKVNVFAC